VALGQRVLPRGWLHLWAQVGLWIGFYVAYLAVRTVADRDPAKAVINGERIWTF